MSSISDRLQSLRELMIRDNLDAYVVYSQDPHGSEYVADHWRCRAWISGFTGSAGTFVITREDAGVWTDFRYFIQAEQELQGTGIQLFRAGEPGVPDYRGWLCSQLPPGSIVGMDGRTLSVKEWEFLAGRFGAAQFSIANKQDLIGVLWKERPEVPENPVWLLKDKEAGESRADKLKRVRREMEKKGVSHYLLSSLDDIAWLLNVRGGDVPYNPVVQSYLLLSLDEASWYVNERKLAETDKAEMEKDGMTLSPYEQIGDCIAGLPEDAVLLISPEKTNSLLAGTAPAGIQIFQSQDITTRMKAIKNGTEQEQIRRVMEKDGAAMVRFLMWLEKEITVRRISELEAAAVLRDFRSRQEGFLDESFSPIPGYRAHGAICHYEAEEETQFMLDASGLFLIDSGGQYREGTTDITRTVTLGEPTEQEIEDYTMVLKGHIALSMARFPLGTRGYQLDILARKPLWEKGLNYGHGTGHGVGYMLNVHEGPQKISPHPIDEPFLPGMVTSNEPGIYREGHHGIRIENLVMTVPWEDCPTKDIFYRFETLTLSPYDQKLIDPSLLTGAEKDWINAYQEDVFRRLSPLVDEGEKNWLAKATRKIA